MTYLQLALRGVPAVVRHANTFSLEIYESAHTPPLLPFLQLHGDAFRRWQQKVPTAPVVPPPSQGDSSTPFNPNSPRGARHDARSPLLVPRRTQRETPVAEMHFRPPELLRIPSGSGTTGTAKSARFATTASQAGRNGVPSTPRRGEARANGFPIHRFFVHLLAATSCSSIGIPTNGGPSCGYRRHA
jgi:hypothetical protein